MVLGLGLTMRPTVTAVFPLENLFHDDHVKNMIPPLDSAQQK
jgi:hypothetical protein